jgi:hypothetical protein
MSPSAREMAAIWLASQSVGIRPSRTIWPKIRPHSLVWVRDLAGLPQQPHARPAGGQFAEFRLAGQGRQCLDVAGLVAADQPGAGRRRVQAAQQRIDIGEIQPVVAPDQLRQRIELMVLHCIDQVRGQRQAVAGAAEGAVAHAAAGAAGNLRDLRRGQPARPVAVELGQPGERDMVDIHVQPHPDGVGRDQEIDLLFLVQRHLGVACARRQPAHHHRAAAPAAADRLGDGVNLAGAERHHGRARRQLGQLGVPGMGQLRQPRARVDLGLRDQLLEQRADGLRTQEHRLHHAARLQQPLGEDVAAVGIGAELDFVDSYKLRLSIERHRLDGAGKPARFRRQDLLLPGDQRDVPGALAGDHLVVILTRQQAQRKADDARRVGQQAFHGQMGLAGVRRTQDSLHAGREIRHVQMVEAAGRDCKPF